MSSSSASGGHSLFSEGPQPATLAIATLLNHLRADWGGKLILSCGLTPLGQAVALAANVAGATCLSIEPDAALCRTAMRAGACDFLVNTVDEALRVLKNEIRKLRPLSVALELDTAAALNELLDRGLLPELFTTTSNATNEAIYPLINNLQPHGMTVLNLDGTLKPVPNAINGPQQLQSLLAQQNLQPHTRTLENAAALKVFDARLQALIPRGDLRHPWLLAAPRLFHRDRPYRRAVLLTQEELTAIT